MSIQVTELLQSRYLYTFPSSSFTSICSSFNTSILYTFYDYLTSLKQLHIWYVKNLHKGFLLKFPDNSNLNPSFSHTLLNSSVTDTARLNNDF